jgi:hypothetical protein
MKGVMQAMLMRKLKLLVVAVLVMAALGAVGLAWRPGDEARAQDAAARKGDGKPLNELEALRRENQRLRKNIEILLDRISAQDQELKTARAQAVGSKDVLSAQQDLAKYLSLREAQIVGQDSVVLGGLKTLADPAHEVEAALKSLREARDPEARRRAAQALERATQRLRQQIDPEATPRKKGA